MWMIYKRNKEFKINEAGGWIDTNIECATKDEAIAKCSDINKFCDFKIIKVIPPDSNPVGLDMNKDMGIWNIEGFYLKTKRGEK